MHVRSLTRQNRQGEVYQRTEAVEKQIRFALDLEPAAVIEAAQIRDYRARNYLQEECLVYLVREYKSRGERGVVEKLSEILLQRCAKYVNDGVRNLRSETGDHSRTVEHAFRDVVEELFKQILDLDSDKGDFLQVRFWVVVDKLRIGAFNRYLENLNRAKAAVAWDSVAGYGQSAEEGEGRKGGKHRGADSKPPQEAGLSAEERLAYLDTAREVLDYLDEPYRTAFVLRHYYDWPIESEDERLPSISRYFGKTSRTIGDWLKRAREAIESRKGEKT